MNQTVIIVHVVAGTVALASGAAALIAPKGRSAHIRAGTVFFGSMMVMTSAGTILAIQRHSSISIQGGTLAFYLVLTSWLAARRRDGVAGSIERGAFLFALACVLLGLSFAGRAAASESGRLQGVPWAGYLPFTSLAALCAVFDLRFLLRERSAHRQRIARHVWRMSTALLIAALSFFVGQQKVMPAAVRGSPLLLIPPFLVFATMIFWLVRLRFAKLSSGKIGAVFVAKALDSVAVEGVERGAFQ